MIIQVASSVASSTAIADQVLTTTSLSVSARYAAVYAYTRYNLTTATQYSVLKLSNAVPTVMLNQSWAPESAAPGIIGSWHFIAISAGVVKARLALTGVTTVALCPIAWVGLNDTTANKLLTAGLYAGSVAPTGGTFVAGVAIVSFDSLEALKCFLP